MNWSVAFQPLVSLPLLVAAIALLLALAAAGVAYGVRGAWVRAAAAAALLLAIANPTLLREEREPLKSVVAVVVDRSQSQTVGSRAAQTDAALAALKDRLGRFPQFELRVVEATSGASGSAGAATNLFEALSAALRDVPPSRVGGAVMITDGQVH
ncbi:MAG TPA: hypothetical protein PKE65_02325, partial [Rhizobiaceae bacterium]|nr:hypothetical protein [Rhizobiaceae bacterium]